MPSPHDETAYSDFSNAEKQRNFLIPEEFPEGCYGMSFHFMDTVTHKETPRKPGQRDQSAFNYEFKN
ncbi:MAG TPA: cytosolic protein, partial [Bacillales bacterium]|nr:cytosolic protein [Bacillales bacterium]